jgi:HEAT repeat protein
MKMGIFGPPDVGKLKTKGDVNGLIKASQNQDPTVHQAALDALAALGQTATDVLVARLGDTNELLRAQSADILMRLNWQPGNATEQVALLVAKQKWADLAHMGEPAVIPLINLLKSRMRGTGVDFAAMAVLSYIGSPAAVGALVEVLENGFLYEAAFAMIAVTQMGSEAAQRVAKMLVNPAISDDRKIGASQILAIIGLTVLPAVLDTIQSTSGTSQAYALMSLVGTGDPQAVGTIRRYLPNLEQDTREEFEQLLSYLDASPDRLIAVLKDPNPGFRAIAAMVLGSRGQTEAVTSLVSLLKDLNPLVVWSASNALGKIGDSTAVEGLLGMLNRSEQVHKIFGIVALGQNRDNATVKSALINQLKDASLAVRAFAAIAIENISKN